LYSIFTANYGIIRGVNNQSLVRVPAEDIQPVVEFVAQLLTDAIEQNKRIVWLVSGGSCIPLAVGVQAYIGDRATHAGLDVLLMDERYGDVGHKGSNSAQLKDAGFNVDSVSYTEVLDGSTIDETTERFAHTLDELKHKADVVIGLFGMGADGHTSGLLPGNSLMESEVSAGHFEGPDFPRITTTPRFLRNVTHAVLYAVGEKKWPALERINDDGSASELPVRIVRSCENLTIFSDVENDI